MVAGLDLCDFGGREVVRISIGLASVGGGCLLGDLDEGIDAPRRDCSARHVE